MLESSISTTFNATYFIKFCLQYVIKKLFNVLLRKFKENLNISSFINLTLKIMRKFTFVLAVFIAISLNTIGQTGWTMVDSGLPSGKGVGQISVGMNDNTAMWGMAINNDGGIFDAFTRSTDGGNTWEAGTFNAGSGLSMLFAIDANTCWAVFNTGANQGLYKTTDGGAIWEK